MRPLAWLRRHPVLCLLLPFLALGALAAWTRPPTLPSYEQARADWRASEAWLKGRDGRLLQTVRIDFAVRRLEWVPLERVSPSLREAVVASEDRHFPRHGGVDWSAFAGSA